MKEIFDWLREQMEWNQIIEMHFDGTPPKQYVERERWVDVINEAEAKWESDCCEWTQKLGNTFVVAVSHENKVFTRTDMKFCPYCGKRIKIVEVE